MMANHFGSAFDTSEAGSCPSAISITVDRLLGVHICKMGITIQLRGKVIAQFNIIYTKWVEVLHKPQSKCWINPTYQVTTKL